MRTVLMAATMIAVGQIAIAQDAPAPSASPQVIPSDSDSQAAAAAPEPVLATIVARDGKFAAALAEAQRLQNTGKSMEAYVQYITLARRWPEDPDVLWGIGECGLAAALSEGKNPALKRKILSNARAAYQRYARAERRSEYMNGPTSRVQAARDWVPHIVAEIEKIPADPAPAASAAATPPAPAVATPSAPAPRPAEMSAPAAVASAATQAVTPSPGPAPVASQEAVAEREADMTLKPATESLAKANTLARAGRLHEAIVEVEALLAQNPNDLLLQGQVVIWSVMLGKCRQALERYERIHLVCAHANVHEAAARCADETNEGLILLHAIEGTVRVSSYVEPTVYADLGKIYANMGETEKATAAFKQYLAVEQRAKYAAQRKEVMGFLAELSSASAPVKQRRVVPPEDRLKCLATRGLLVAQFVSGTDGQFTMRLQPPPNWESIPCSAK